ncbi:MAG: CPBP family intramembrane metalloprotease [Lachnospiraceae bacterium]|nr:CPBP family intramembrane metalloprotease [Lachnospiraceae bacterium]
MRKTWTLVKKEILDILRDKKTLVIMVAVPILLYPAIIIGMVLVMNFMMQSREGGSYTAAYAKQYKAEALRLQEVYEEKKEELDISLTFLEVPEKEKGDGKSSYDVWINFVTDGQGLHIEVEYTSTDSDSSYAENAMEELADIYCEKLLEDKLGEKGLTVDFLYPVTYEAKDSVTVSESAGMSIGGSIGMMLVVTIMLGAFYPAIDVTTGEKERGTLETLLTLPVTNFQMIMSKYIAVSIFSCITAVLSLLSLGGSVMFLLGSAMAGASEEILHIEPAVFMGWIPLLLLVVIVTALLVTAFSMCFCVFAKSFKEANNYITPVMLVVMFASMTAMIPSMQLDGRTALIPIVNVSLLMKQVLAQQMELTLAGITIGINFCYSVLIIWVLAKIYNSENVLFHDGFQSFRLFEKRSAIKEGTVPGTGDLLLSTVVLLLLILYLGTAVSVRSPFGGTLVNQFLILLTPLFAVWYMKSDVKTLFSLKIPSGKSVLGGLLLYIGTYLIMLVAATALSRIFPESTQNVEQAFGEILDHPFILIILVMAVMPAVGEEIFFRGLLFGGFRHRHGAFWGILLSSLIFGAFHMSIVKLLPTAMLGACFAYIGYCSGSIYIGMFLHFLNNLISMALSKYPEQMGRFLPFLVEELSGKDIFLMLVIGCLSGTLGLIVLKKKVK